MSTPSHALEFSLNGKQVMVAEDNGSLLAVLRDGLGVVSVKDGCSPQGQCGCCTVLIDGQPRVSCVTPARRVAGREITTLEGLDGAEGWADAMCATGGSQCGFCTPGIIVRLAGAAATKGELTPGLVRDALKAHLCRCTGWQTIVEAAVDFPGLRSSRDLVAAGRRAAIEGRSPQQVSPDVARGQAGFADDTAPADALVAVRAGDDWVVAESLTEARERAGKIQGRRTTIDATPPIEVPDGAFDRTLQTTWVEPGYLETDASWCEPGGDPATPLANGGAFGAKAESVVGAQARRLADLHGRPVRVLFSREDSVRFGPKRPPLAAGIRADGTGVMHVARTPGIADAVASVAPALDVVEVDIEGPPTSAAIRGAGWVEAAVLWAAASGNPTIGSPDGSTAAAVVTDDGIDVEVSCGEVLDEVVLRSYCIGAAHMAYSWVTAEALAVASDGEIQDLTVRSFGIVRAVDMPRVEVVIKPGVGEAVNGSDAVFAAVAAATWASRAHSARWPTG